MFVSGICMYSQCVQSYEVRRDIRSPRAPPPTQCWEPNPGAKAVNNFNPKAGSPVFFTPPPPLRLGKLNVKGNSFALLPIFLPIYFFEAE